PAAASAAGVGEGVFVVAYGNMGGAERLWWLLRHFGHDDCAVIDLDAWRGPPRGGVPAGRARRRSPPPPSSSNPATATRSPRPSSPHASTTSSSSTPGSR